MRTSKLTACVRRCLRGSRTLYRTAAHERMSTRRRKTCFRVVCGSCRSTIWRTDRRILLKRATALAGVVETLPAFLTDGEDAYLSTPPNRTIWRTASADPLHPKARRVCLAFVFERTVSRCARGIHLQPAAACWRQVSAAE